MAQFQCRFRDADLCFDPSGNASCALTPQGWQQCECSTPTFGPDNLYLHLATCSLPKNFYEGYLAGYILVLFICCVLLGPIGRNAREGTLARRIVLWACLHHLLMVVFALCLLIQRGYFEAAAIVYALKNCVAVWLIHLLLMMMLEPVYIGANRDFRPLERRLVVLRNFQCACLIIYGCFLAAYTRNGYVYNHLALGSISLNALLCFCAAVALSKITAQMIKTLDLLRPEAAILDAKERLRKARRNFTIIAVAVGTSPLFFIPYGLMGSIPFAFVFAMMIDMGGFGLIFPTQIYMVLRQKSTVKTRPQARTPLTGEAAQHSPNAGESSEMSSRGFARRWSSANNINLGRVMREGEENARGGAAHHLPKTPTDSPGGKITLGEDNRQTMTATEECIPAKSTDEDLNDEQVAVV